MTVKIHGNQYVTVVERMDMMRQSEKPFEIVESMPIQVGDRCVWRVAIMLGDFKFYGSAECHFNAKPGTADATDPFACAETSAIGRALGFAGYGAVESIASADEVVRNQEPAPQPKPALQTVPAQPETPAVKELQKRCNALFGVGFWQAMILKALKVENMDIVLKDSDLTADDRLAIQKYMDFAEARKAS